MRRAALVPAGYPGWLCGRGRECVCVGGGGGLFALISHLRKTVMYILNTLIPRSTSSLSCSLPACGALITFGDDAVILRRMAVGVGGVGDKGRRCKRWKEGEILMACAFISC